MPCYLSNSEIKARWDLIFKNKKVLQTLTGSDIFCAMEILSPFRNTWPSIREIQEGAGVSRATAVRAIRKLDRTGVIPKVSGGGRMKNTYLPKLNP